ncbi:unnamed protein product [Mytilus edulis]|uniref:Uncharacterized protein n=1 Tax=Mytilus edulis TaxID=6550 RepID=A0A8S3QL94_MYTED|nr:unnamed protein product [Mytilus edulis]
MSLPCSTEWILTTQSDINVLLRKIKEKRDAGEWYTTQIFNDLSKAAWKYRKDILPDGFVLDIKRNEIVLSSPGQLPNWLNDELERFETEKTRPCKSVESGVSDETATTSYASTPGQKKIHKTKTDTTAQSSKEVPVSNCPTTPEEAVTEASPKRTGRKTASTEDTGTKKATPSSPEGTKTGSSGKGRGKKTSPSLPEESSTERRSKGRGKKSSPSLPEETRTERSKGREKNTPHLYQKNLAQKEEVKVEGKKVPHLYQKLAQKDRRKFPVVVTVICIRYIYKNVMYE